MKKEVHGKRGKADFFMVGPQKKRLTPSREERQENIYTQF